MNGSISLRHFRTSGNPVSAEIERIKLDIFYLFDCEIPQHVWASMHVLLYKKTHISAVPFPALHHPSWHYCSTVRQLVIKNKILLEKLASSVYFQTLQPKHYAIKYAISILTLKTLLDDSGGTVNCKYSASYNI